MLIKRSHIIIALVAVLVVLLSLWLSQQTQQREEIPLVTPTPAASIAQATYRQIVPGVSTSAQALALLGQPLRTDTLDDQSTLVYPAGIEDRVISVHVDEQETVTHVVVPLQENVTLSAITSPLGLPDAVMYGTYFRSGFSLQVYLTHGTAVLGNRDTNEALFQWYFPPMAFEEFHQSLAPGYTLTKPDPLQE